MREFFQLAFTAVDLISRKLVLTLLRTVLVLYGSARVVDLVFTAVDMMIPPEGLPVPTRTLQTGSAL